MNNVDEQPAIAREHTPTHPSRSHFRFPAMQFKFWTICLLLVLAGCSGSTANRPVASLTSPVESGATSTEARPPVSALNTESPRYVVRKAIVPAAGASIPPVLLSASHAKLCTIGVGDSFPAITLPRLGSGPTELASLSGTQATVLLFWQPDRWMARTALIDMQRDVAAQFNAQQVAVVGVAIRQSQVAVQAALSRAQAAFPQLIDTEGSAFAAVGTNVLPRIYVLDSQGKIVWFDIEYSEGTRRELWQTLRVLTNE